MTVLSDRSIEEAVNQWDMIMPYTIDQLQPASYDLSLGTIRIKDRLIDSIYSLDPQEFIIASTIEKVSLPSHIVGRIEGKSSWARKGLIIHTAGFIDPGFVGQVTLEITNLSKKPIPLKVGELICQIAFQTLDWPARRPYGHPELKNHYQNQVGPTPSAIQ